MRRREREKEVKGERVKRVRVEGGDKKREVDEEREFLVGVGEDGEDDGGGGLSKETRDLLEKVGLGGGSREENEEQMGEEEIKVSPVVLFGGKGLTGAGLLHLSHTLATHTVHLGAATSGLPSVAP